MGILVNGECCIICNTSQFSQTFQFRDETPRFNHLISSIIVQWSWKLLYLKLVTLRRLIWFQDYAPSLYSPGHQCSIQSFLYFLGTLINQRILFDNCSRFSLPLPCTCIVETRNKFWILASNVVCGAGGVAGHGELKKSPTNANLSRDFYSWL